MNKIEKLMRKIRKRDRQKLLALLTELISDPRKFRAIKLQRSEFYRLRSERFRIIFHYENKDIVIDSVKLRDEKTYK